MSSKRKKRPQKPGDPGWPIHPRWTGAAFGPAELTPEEKENLNRATLMRRIKGFLESGNVSLFTGFVPYEILGAPDAKERVIEELKKAGYGAELAKAGYGNEDQS